MDLTSGSDNLVFSGILAALAKLAANSRCQCEDLACGHSGRCNAPLEEPRLKTRYRVAPSAGGRDSVDNCEVICLACYQGTAAGGARSE